MQPQTPQISFGKELLVVLGVAAIIVAMLLPVPPGLMDFLLVANVIFALILLLSSLYISEPLKLSSLPTILLLATLYRLSLNVSSTRLVLGSGDAGEVIEAFGKVVIQGNLVLGVVVFLIITLVQFIVVAKGSERVAEVAARFTLDAMPGKQMSIDADLRAGLIDGETARQKRQDLQTESRFYGALDGSMKFVKGDAIAGLVITAVNAIGGLSMGILMYELEPMQALSKYTLLTIGDGLVSQIPALLNSIAAGIVVTRVTRGEGSSLAGDMVSQLGSGSKVKAIVAIFAVALALLPGMPFMPFAVFGAMLFLAALARPKEVPKDTQATAFQPKTPAIITVEIKSDLGRAVSSVEAMGQALDGARQRIFERTGLIFQRPYFAVNNEQSSAYRIKIRGITVLARALDLNQKDLDVSREISGSFAELVESRPHEFIDDIMTRRLLDFFDKEAPELVSAVVPGVISLTQLTGILRQLSEEGVSVVNFDAILQAVAEHGAKAGGDRRILEEVRVGLRRLISSLHADQSGDIAAVLLDPVLDMAFMSAEREGKSVDPGCVEQVITALRLEKEKHGKFVLVVSKAARRLLYECLKLRGSTVPVVAFDELASECRLVSIGEIKLNGEEQAEKVLMDLAA